MIEKQIKIKGMPYFGPDAQRPLSGMFEWNLGSTRRNILIFYFVIYI